MTGWVPAIVNNAELEPLAGMQVYQGFPHPWGPQGGGGWLGGGIRKTLKPVSLSYSTWDLVPFVSMSFS